MKKDVQNVDNTKENINDKKTENHAGMGLAKVDGSEAPVVGRQLLLDDICLDRYANMVGLPGHIGRTVIVRPIFLEVVVSQVTPQDGGHSQLVRVLECFGYFHDLPTALPPIRNR